MASMSDIRNGMIIKFKGGLYEFTEFLHVKPGKGAAFVRTKLRNLNTGQVIENTFRNSDRFEEVRVEKSKKQYLYADTDFYVFMDNDTYEQLSVPHEQLEDISKFLMDNIDVTMRMDPEGNIIGVELPISVVQEIVECEPNVKGNTASGSGKTATTETGLSLTIPFFVEKGEKVKIDTRTGEYIERA